jgi:hypothetical protein
MATFHTLIASFTASRSAGPTLFYTAARRSPTYYYPVLTRVQTRRAHSPFFPSYFRAGDRPSTVLIATQHQDCPQLRFNARNIHTRAFVAVNSFESTLSAYQSFE